MNKRELIEKVAEKNGTSKVEAAKAVNAVIRTMAETLKKGEKISLLKLGSFTIRERKERNGYNPNSKENTCGSRISRGRRSAAQPVSVESPPQRFPAGPAQAGGGLPRGGNQPLRDAGTRRLGYSALRGASKIFVKNSALDGNFSPLPCVSTGKRSRCSPESIGKDERE